MSEYLEDAELRMESAIENLQENLHKIRTGRASAQILDSVEFDYYGAPTPIKQMASINVVEGTQLVIKPYDRQSVKGIAHAIQAANLGLNPQAEADVIRIQVPSLTEERRKELAKDAQKMGEQAKVAIRNIRRDCNDAIKKDKELREDEEKDALEQSQKFTDSYVKKVEEVVKKKVDDIMTV